jgi:LmbE family N-acetylglucosaminyl deacetylase
VGDSDTFQFLVAIIAVGLALVGLLIMTVVAVVGTWRQHGDTRSTHRATIEALSRIEEIVRSWAPGGPALSLARAPLPPLEGAPNDSEALRSLLPLLSELDESFRKMSEARTAYSGQVAASLASSEAALRALEESTERIIQGLHDFMEQVRAGNGENYNRSSS